ILVPVLERNFTLSTRDEDFLMATPAGGVYPRVDMSGGGSNFPAMEEEVQKYWKKDNTFQASLDNREGNEEYVFNDGPTFDNRFTHYGHMLTGYDKYLVSYYRTIAG